MTNDWNTVVSAKTEPLLQPVGELLRHGGSRSLTLFAGLRRRLRRRRGGPGTGFPRLARPPGETPTLVVGPKVAQQPGVEARSPEGRLYVTQGVADRFAAETTGEPGALVSALKKLSADNLSNLTPHPFYVFLNESHPPLPERVAALRSLPASR